MKIVFKIAICLLMMTCQSLAQKLSSTFTIDPGIIFSIPGNAIQNAYKDTTGKSLKLITINPSERTLLIYVLGQSLSTNLTTQVYNPTNSTKIDNYQTSTGLLYSASNPLLGTSWNGSVPTSANFNLQVADVLITNGIFDRVILVPLAVPGTSIYNWTNDNTGTESTGYYRALCSAALKLQTQGVSQNTPGVKVLVKWNQGESETSTTASDYVAGMHTLINSCSTLSNVKWMIAKETWLSGAINPTIQAAQTSMWNGTTIFQGEDMDSINNTGRQADMTHLNAIGGSLAAGMGVTQITAIPF